MKKRTIAALLSIVMVLCLLAGCGGSGSNAKADDAKEDTTAEEPAAEEKANTEEPAEEAAAPAGDAVVLKLASIKATENYMYQGQEMFKKAVEEASNGSIVIELYPASQLGGQNEIVEGLNMGTIEMGFLAPSITENSYPKASVLGLLFLAQNEDHALRMWEESDMAAEVKEGLRQELNMRILGLHIEGARHIFTTVPVEKLDDLKGVKLRVPEVPLFVSSFTALGCNPTPMSMSDVYTGLQTGIVEGLENDMPAVLSNNFADFCKYCYKTSHAVTISSFVIADTVWEKLSSEQQEIIQKAVDEADVWLNEEYYRQVEETEAQLEEMGMTIVTPSEEDRAAMIEILNPIVEETIEGLCTPEDLDTLRALAN